MSVRVEINGVAHVVPADVVTSEDPAALDRWVAEKGRSVAANKGKAEVPPTPKKGAPAGAEG